MHNQNESKFNDMNKVLIIWDECSLCVFHSKPVYGTHAGLSPLLVKFNNTKFGQTRENNDKNTTRLEEDFLMSSPARATRSHGGIPGTLSPSVKRASPKSESGPPRARMRLSDTPQPTSPMPKKRKSPQSK